MHDKEYKSLINGMKDLTRRLKKGDPAAKKTATELLIKAGIITEKGNLRYPYRGSSGYTVSKRKNAKLKEDRV